MTSPIMQIHNLINASVDDNSMVNADMRLSLLIITKPNK